MDPFSQREAGFEAILFGMSRCKGKEGVTDMKKEGVVRYSSLSRFMFYSYEENDDNRYETGYAHSRKDNIISNFISLNLRGHPVRRDEGNIVRESG